MKVRSGSIWLDLAHREQQPLEVRALGQSPRELPRALVHDLVRGEIEHGQARRGERGGEARHGCGAERAALEVERGEPALRQCGGECHLVRRRTVREGGAGG